MTVSDPHSRWISASGQGVGESGVDTCTSVSLLPRR